MSGPNIRAALAAVVAGSAAATLVVAATAGFGIGLTPDSAVYVEVAGEAVEGEGFVRATGQPFVHAPPGYPALLAAIGARPGEMGKLRLLHAALAAMQAGLLVLLWSRSLPVRWVLVGAVLAVATWPHARVTCFAWSEGLFLPLAIGFLIAAARRQEDPGLPADASMFLLAGCAAMTRYAGLTLIGTALVIVLCDRRLPARGRVVRVLGLGGLSVLPLFLWLARNLTLAGTPAGARGVGTLAPVDHMKDVLQVARSWLGTDTLSGPAGAALSLIVCLVVGAGFVARMREEREALRAELPCLLLAATYLAFMLVSASTTGFDRLNTRLLSPAFPALLTLALGGLAGLKSLPGRRSHWRRLVAALALTLASAVALGHAARTVQGVLGARSGGIGGYATPVWAGSSLLGAVRSLPAEVEVVSNAPGAVYLLAGRASGLSPRRTLYASSAAVEGEVEELAARLEAGEAVALAWFFAPSEPHLFRPEELVERLGVTPVARARDGILFRLSTLRGAQGSTFPNQNRFAPRPENWLAQ